LVISLSEIAMHVMQAKQ